LTVTLSICKFLTVFVDDTLSSIAPNDLRLDAGGGITKARTRANDDVTYPLSAENTPPLAPNRLLEAGCFFVFQYRQLSKYKQMQMY